MGRTSWSRHLRLAAAGILLLAAAALGFGIIVGFFGSAVRLFDTAAQFRGHAGVALGVVAFGLFAVRLWLAGIASLGAAGLALASVLPLVLPQPPESPERAHYTLLQMNVRYDAPDKLSAMRLIAQLSPDIVTAEEVTGDWQALFATIRSRYPYQAYCGYTEEETDTAILSRRPFVEGDTGMCDVWGGISSRKIDFNGTALTLAAVHLRWPFPGRQWRQIGSVEAMLATLKDPLLIAGDFNSAPWTASLREFAALSGTRITPGIGPSWFVPMFPASFIGIFGLPIDNVLTSPAVTITDIRTAAPTGSDHLPVVVHFTINGTAEPEPTVQTVRRD